MQRGDEDLSQHPVRSFMDLYYNSFFTLLSPSRTPFRLLATTMANAMAVLRGKSLLVIDSVSPAQFTVHADSSVVVAVFEDCHEAARYLRIDCRLSARARLFTVPANELPTFVCISFAFVLEFCLDINIKKKIGRNNKIINVVVEPSVSMLL